MKYIGGSVQAKDRIQAMHNVIAMGVTVAKFL
jgi:hypothetical protein